MIAKKWGTSHVDCENYDNQLENIQRNAMECIKIYMAKHNWKWIGTIQKHKQNIIENKKNENMFFKNQKSKQSLN